MLWAEKRLVSAKHSSSCKHFICSIATWINTWNSIGFTLKSDWRHLFSSSLYSISILHPLLYSFAVDVERQLSVESIFHRFRFHLKEICKGLTILEQDCIEIILPHTLWKFTALANNNNSRHFSMTRKFSRQNCISAFYSREHLNRIWCRKFLFQSDLILQHYTYDFTLHMYVNDAVHERDSCK